MSILKRFIPVSIILTAIIFAGLVSSLWASKPLKTEQTNNKVVGVVEIKASEPTTIVNTPSSGVTTSPTPSVTSSPAVQTNQINVSINNSPNFTVSVSEGASQCEVLSKALEQGKIASLNIKYNSTHQTYAIYQINGVGKENSVWWNYSVNGSNPPLGCSHVKANNNDNVVWTYIGPG